MPVLSKITVMYDTILDPTNGIIVTNVKSWANNVNYYSTVRNNYIVNNKLGIISGIQLTACDQIGAYCNTITRNASPSPSLMPSVRGLMINQSINATVHDNTSILLGYGIIGVGSLLGTQFRCNSSDRNYNGFYFENNSTAISTQGTDQFPTDNNWVYYNSNPGIAGDIILPEDWYYRNVGGLPTYIPTKSLSISSYISLYASINPSNLHCSSCLGSKMMEPVDSNLYALQTEINNQAMGAIIGDSNNYNELNASFKYFEKQYAYDVLNNEDVTGNETLSDYLATLKDGGIGKFDAVYGMIGREQFDSAGVMNQSIEPINTIEENRKLVNAVYLQYVVPQQTLPNNTISELYSLATASPFVEGDAVYTARVILGMEAEEFEDHNLSDSITIRGFLKGPLCSDSVPIAGDTIAIIDASFTRIDYVTPAITDTSGYFKFDIYDLMHLEDTTKYSFVSKRGLVYTDTVFKTVQEWINFGVVNLYLEKVKSGITFDTLSCLPFTEHYTSNIKFGLKPYTYNWDFGFCRTSAKDTSFRFTIDTLEAIYAKYEHIPARLIVRDSLGCVDTLVQHLDYLIALEECSTITGTLSENGNCGENVIANDTLVIIDHKYNFIKDISPAITGADGSFKFDYEELSKLDSSGLYNIATKSGFSLDIIEPIKISDWINNSPITLQAANAHQEWVATFIGPDSLNDQASALDLANSIYVVGLSKDSTGNQFAVIKYDSMGIQQWVARLDTAYPSFSIWMSSIVADSFANVYIAGAYSALINQDTTKYGLMIAKIDSTGEIKWIHDYKNFTWLNTNTPSTIGLYLDHQNNVVVGLNNYMNPGFLINKYDYNGTLLWNYNNTTTEPFVSMNAMAIDSLDNIYISGKKSTSSGWESMGSFLTLKLHSSGTIVWSTMYPSAIQNNINYMATSDMFDNLGYLYVTGFDVGKSDSVITIKYHPSTGYNPVWVKSFSPKEMGYDNLTAKTPNKVLADNLGNIYVYGTGYVGGNASLYVVKYKDDGQVLWTMDHYTYNDNLLTIINSATLDLEGNLYLTGSTANYDSTSNSINYLTIKINTAGDLVWSEIYKGPYDNDQASCIEVSENGNVYITGGSVWNETGGSEYATVKYAQCPSKATYRSMTGSSNNESKPPIKQSLKVYPNPTKDEFYVEYSGDVTGQRLEVELYTIYGALMKHVIANSVNKMTVSTRDLSAGIYFYRVKLDNTTIGKDKIVVIK